MISKLMINFRRSSSVNLPPEEKKKSDHKPKKIDMERKNFLCVELF